MEKLTKIVFFLLLFLVTSCSEDSSVNNSDIELRKILASKSSGAEISVIDLKTGNSIENIDLASQAGMGLQGNVSKIYHFGGKFYLMMPEDKKIIVLNKSDRSLAGVVDLEEFPKNPDDMTFAPNGTTAYVNFEDYSVVSVIDITVNQPAKTIEYNSVISDVLCNGNVLYAAGLTSDELYAVSTTDLSPVKTVKTPARPYLLEFTNKNNELYVISAGIGKHTLEDGLSPANVTFYKPETLEEVKTFELAIPQLSAQELVPFDVINTVNDWSFVITQNYIVRFDASNRGRTGFFLQGKFDYQFYDITKDKVYFYTRSDGGRIYKTTPYSPEIQENISVSDKLSSFHIFR